MMILKKLVTEKVVEYFKSEQWNQLIKELKRGDDVLHVHAYSDSILAPQPLAKIIKGYFDAIDMPLQRKPIFVPSGKGIVDVYGIHPKGCGHFELFMNYTDQVVLESPKELFRGEKKLEVWDKQYMSKFYQKFKFRDFEKSAEADVKAYFKSPAWENCYIIMMTRGNYHSHALIRTSIHPEILLEYGVKAIESKGWIASKTTSVVFGMHGADQGKVVFLVRKPDMILELEWEFDSAVTIVPGPVPVYRIYTEDHYIRETAHCNYFTLEDDQINEVIASFKQ
jgi:hypothetical protein